MTTTESVAQTPPFTFGELLVEGIRLFARRFVLFVAMAIVFQAAQPVLLFMLTDTSAVAPGSEQLGLKAALILASVIGTGLTSAVVMYAVVKELQGDRVGFGAAVRTGLVRLIPVLGTIILQALAISLGMLLFIIPGLIVSVMLWVAVPGSVVERLGPIASLMRSSDLTRGHRWTIFGITLFFGVVQEIALRVLEAALLSRFATEADVTTYIALVYGQSVLFTALFSVITGYGYYLLVSHKEGTNIDKLASVFD